MNQKCASLYLFAVLLYLFCVLRLGSLAVGNRAALSMGEENQAMRAKMSVAEGFVEVKMDFESLDYPGSGANNRHEPRAPGKPGAFG